MKRKQLLKSISLITLLSTLIAFNPTPSFAAWKENSTGWWYDYGNSYATGWKNIKGKWYYFDNSGYMKTGWLKDGSTWYYLNNSGDMKTGWLKDNSNWYYLDNSGAMKTGWIKDGSTWYYLDNSGAMKTGWLRYSSNWYFLDESGAMQTGWAQITEKGKAYFNIDGSQAVGWTEIDGKTYYFIDGAGMTYNDIRDHYYIDDSGVKGQAVRYETVDSVKEVVEKEDSTYISKIKEKASDLNLINYSLLSHIPYAKEFGIDDEPCINLVYGSNKDDLSGFNYFVGLYTGKIYCAPGSLGRTYEIKNNEIVKTYDASSLYNSSNVSDWR